MGKETIVTGCFVRCLFGDHQILNFPGVLDEARWCVVQPQPEPLLWYCYGEANRDHLRACGVEPTMLSPEPFCQFGHDDGKGIKQQGIVRGGSSLWRHKYPAIADALERYPAAVWLDMDTLLSGLLPPDFWARMAKGQAFQGTLGQFGMKHARWRTEDVRKIPLGAFLYWRGRETIRRMLDLYAEHPAEWDMIVLARLVDEMMGGWKGTEAYKAMGFNTYCHVLVRYLRSQIWAPEVRLFCTYMKRKQTVREALSEKLANG